MQVLEDDTFKEVSIREATYSLPHKAKNFEFALKF